MIQTLQDLKSQFYQTLAPPPDLNVWQWADEYRVLASEASSEPGPWRTDRFPFWREVMFELSPQSSTEEIVCMCGAQVGKTEICLNLMGYTIHWDPGPMLYVQKTLDAVRKFSAQRFKKSLENSPVIRGRLPEAKSRDDANTIFVKNFPGGILILGGANSAASLRSMPIRILMLDEEDSFDADIDEEGDPAELAIVRTNNFPRRKIFHLSSPKIEETSKIEPLYKEGDQRSYNVPCPFCKKKQTIDWAQIKFKRDKKNFLVPGSVYLQCKFCKKRIREHHKTWMLENGIWIAAEPQREIASFHLNALYSPLGFFSWDKAVNRFLRYVRTLDTEKLKVHINSTLGETFSEKGKKVDYGMLESRKEEYPAPAPAGVLIITAGVDVQDDRIEVETVGWGEHEENWSLDYSRFMGDPEYDDVWQLLDLHLKKTWGHESGAELPIACTGIDSGYVAKRVYKFCRAREERRIFPVKGTDGWGKGLINRPNKRNKDRVWLTFTYADELKSKIYSMLKAVNPGPSHCHFPNLPDYDANYFRMLTAEKLRRKRSGGKYILKWELPAGRRNEALDCRQYAIAALNILNPDLEKLKAENGPVVLKPRKVRKVKKRVLSKGL